MYPIRGLKIAPKNDPFNAVSCTTSSFNLPNSQKIVYLPTFVDAFRGYQGVGHHAFATRVHKQPMFLQNFMIPF